MSTIALDRTGTRHDRRVQPTRHLRAVPNGVVSSGAATDVRTARVRLTTRGKVAVVTLVIAVIAVLAVAFGPSTAATDQTGTPLQTSTVTVMPGLTLWQIAAEANPNGDIRRTVDDIVQLNSLPNASALQMGSTISVPVYE
ncbi:LysM domain-containing protein [Aeromicrobium sp.]|uniref:LysM peptidoglycan-binding domain-containing protein n=1 Tax=Aeromicrobium sp. TaxID=1871063 RepID=UPI0019C59DFE|nr:LysM domain-containing protein [Aeromicrobium sp.]MBC7630481.1 LysM peptidoglycan-binding domain-containing protein [Aeromicrobium sp.]